MDISIFNDSVGVSGLQHFYFVPAERPDYEELLALVKEDGDFRCPFYAPRELETFVRFYPPRKLPTRGAILGTMNEKETRMTGLYFLAEGMLTESACLREGNPSMSSKWLFVFSAEDYHPAKKTRKGMKRIR